MAHRFSLPTEAEMENLIVQVYESLPNPDKSRLSLIESKLLHKARKNKDQKNLNKIPWWIVLLLAGGFASAAWWAGDMYFDRQNTEITDDQSVSSDKMSERESGSNITESETEESEQYNGTYEGGDSPIIYQRESL